MSEEIVKLKGSKYGLQLVFDRDVDFEALKNDITAKLESGSKFFRPGTAIIVEPGLLSNENEQTLKKLFHQHGVLFRVESPEKPKPEVNEEKPKPMSTSEPPIVAQPAPPAPKMMVVNRTVRGGQEITAPGSILICGNVNPGAQIIAGGSIDIRGTCRGLVHAGAYGDISAFIVADKLMPTQIRIADHIAQSPDDAEEPKGAEKASIQGGQIIIESIER